MKTCRWSATMRWWCTVCGVLIGCARGGPGGTADNGEPPEVGSGGGGPGGDTLPDRPVSDGCDGSPDCSKPGEPTCGAEELAIERVSPNLFISLDRSCSMTAPAGTSPGTNWDVAVAAIDTLTSNFAQKIRWGLGLFPDRDGQVCLQGSPAVPIGDGNEPSIQSLLQKALGSNDPNYPSGPCVTNIDTAIEQAKADPALADTSRPGYILLITDGKQAGCNAAGGDPGTETMLQRLALQGVKTFVVGFGKNIDPVQMNRFAQAGGVPRADPNLRYYQANDALDLETALSTIAGSIVGCTFDLQQKPPDPNAIYVYFDDGKVSRDSGHQDGWDYDPQANHVTFFGAACEKLKAGQVQDVDVVFGCDAPTPS